MASSPRVLRPRPRRAFDLPSADSSQPGTPTLEETPLAPTATASSSDYLDAKPSSSTSRTGQSLGQDLSKEDDLPSSRSMMNLTSPTLYGIYSPTAFEGVRDDSGTPWDTGAQTPNPQGRDYFSPHGDSSRRNGNGSNGANNGAGNRKQAVTAEQNAMLSSSLKRQQQQQQQQEQLGRRVVRKHGFRGYVLPLVRRSVMLFLFGMAYGGIITHLHGHPTVAGRVPVRMEKIDIDQRSLGYLALWGVAGVVLGSLQPWFDLFWGDNLILGRSPSADRRNKGNGFLQWSPMVRSIGAFVGIAFAIRKLPWQSTLQVSLTLALVNPVLWYLIDRSKPGFVLSTVVGLTGMLALLGINPTIVPSPATAQPSSSSAPAFSATPINGSTVSDTPMVMGMTHETIAVGTWIASVLFCSCVCFGNIGRRLADSD